MTTQKIWTPPERRKIRAYAVLTTPNRKRELCERQFCWIAIERAMDGHITYKPDRRLEFQSKSKGTVIVVICFFSTKRGRKIIFSLLTEYLIAPDDKVSIE